MKLILFMQKTNCDSESLELIFLTNTKKKFAWNNAKWDYSRIAEFILTLTTFANLQTKSELVDKKNNEMFSA